MDQNSPSAKTSSSWSWFVVLVVLDCLRPELGGLDAGSYTEFVLLWRRHEIMHISYIWEVREIFDTAAEFASSTTEIANWILGKNIRTSETQFRTSGPQTATSTCTWKRFGARSQSVEQRKIKRFQISENKQYRLRVPSTAVSIYDMKAYKWIPNTTCISSRSYPSRHKSQTCFCSAGRPLTRNTTF